MAPSALYPLTAGGAGGRDPDVGPAVHLWSLGARVDTVFSLCPHAGVPLCVCALIADMDTSRGIRATLVTSINLASSKTPSPNSPILR